MEKIVVDTNAVAAALVKEGTSRQILLLPGISFFAPDFLREELEEHNDVFLAKSGLSAEDLDKVCGQTLSAYGNPIGFTYTMKKS
ncbi:MAG: PIN domain-containing protein [Candidatus Micrarchaeia archaeon]